MVHLRTKPIKLCNTSRFVYRLPQTIEKWDKVFTRNNFRKRTLLQVHYTTQVENEQLNQHVFQCHMLNCQYRVKFTYTTYVLLTLLHSVTKIDLSFNHFNKFWLSMFIMEEHSH